MGKNWYGDSSGSVYDSGDRYVGTADSHGDVYDDNDKFVGNVDD